MDEKSWISEDLAYAAGLIDGEGCIGCHNRSRSARLTILMTDKTALKFLSNKFGGNFTGPYLRKKDKNKKCSQQYRWTIYSYELQPFLKAILPYLKVKSKQAHWALKLIPHLHQRKKLTKIEKKIRKKFYLQIRNLNRFAFQKKQKLIYA